MIDVQKLIDIADDNIEDLLSTLLIDYRHEGEWISMPCVMHGGDGYNLRYRNKSFYCFSHCHRGFSIINIVQKVLDLEFIDAIKWLCNELNIKDDDLVVDEKKVAVKANLKRLRALKHKKHIVEYEPVSQDVLNDIERYNHPYILKQGFNKKTLEHFNVGYARAGALEGRVTFPIDSPDGEIISISGRIPTDEDLGVPKYKILGSTDKSKTLYNISRINPNDDYIVVVEGFISVMSLYEFGIKSAVAVMGSSLSEEQKRLLLSLGRKIICIADNDKAGRKLNQQIYNQCYRFCDVVKIDLSEFTDVEKSSPCEQDLGFDTMSELMDKIEELV